MNAPLRWLAGLLAGTAVLVISLIMLGVFDPKPVGELVWERPLPAQTVPGLTRQIFWLDEKTPDADFSLRLTSAHQSGEIDSAYGLLLGSEDDYLVIIISPLGYAAVEERHSSAIISHSAFQPWPHINPNENEIWLDVVDGRIAIRINRERYWAGEVGEIGDGIGVYGESFGETAVIAFPQLQFFAVVEP